MTLQVSPQTRRVFHLSLPIFAELLLQLLVGNMDQFMISHFGSAAVAAIGNGNQVMNVVIIVLTTMSTAATAFDPICSVGLPSLIAPIFARSGQPLQAHQAYNTDIIQHKQQNVNNAISNLI